MDNEVDVSSQETPGPVASALMMILRMFFLVHITCSFLYPWEFPRSSNQTSQILTHENFKIAVVIAILMVLSIPFKTILLRILSVFSYALFMGYCATQTPYINVKGMYTGFCILSLALTASKMVLFKRGFSN